MVEAGLRKQRAFPPGLYKALGFEFSLPRISKIRSTRKGHFGFLCRSGGIRTRGLLVPNQRFGRFFRLFPLPSGICRQRPFLPVFSACFPVFPRISKTVLNWTFDVFLQFYRFNHPLQPTGLQHDRTVLFYIPSATHFASSTFRSSLAFNSSSTLTISG